MKTQKNLTYDQSESIFRAMVAACEFGYKQCEKGNNIDKAIDNFKKFVVEESALQKRLHQKAQELEKQRG